MELIVLAVPGCPNVAVLEQRLGDALAGRPAMTGASPAMACRLYRNADGTIDYAPNTEALWQALKQAGALS